MSKNIVNGKNDPDMCRICLEGDSNINIFRTTALNDLVANLLIDCADVDVSSDDKLPHVICNKCLQLLKTSCELRKQIRSSDIVLRELFENNKSETGEIKKENLLFSLAADNKPDVENTSASPDNKLQAEILTPLSISIPSVQENNAYIDQNMSSPDDFVVDTVIESEDDIAEWILYPQQPSPQPDEPITPAENVHNCCMCKQVFDNFDLLKQHALEDHRKRCRKPTAGSFLRRYFDCNICSRKFNTEFSLEKHQKTYQKLMACAVCGTMVVAKHIKIHAKCHDTELVECDICNKMFKKVYVAEHKLKVHCGEKKFICHLCPDKAFGARVHLARHMTKHETYKKRVVGTCIHCGRTFDSLSSMRNHMIIHTGEKRFSCNHCGEKFMHNTDYRRHVWKHEGSPYSCTKCNKYIDRPSHLKAHQAAGCHKLVSTTRQNKPQRENQEKSKHNQRSPSASSSESSCESDPPLRIETNTYNCGDANCLESFTSKAGYALHLAMHAIQN